MEYRDFKGEKLSLLGFGTMRLPLDAEKNIDMEKTSEMVDIAMSNGVNYFDTAWPYHGGMSEIAIGRALKKYPRDSFNLATKFPGHQISETHYPAEIFEKQLEKCGVEYFDFYLLHNVCEYSIEVFEDEKWGIIDYFIEQKKKGRIRHLGFSSHGLLPNLTGFLDRHGKDMEFCQIQLNYLDWTLQKAKEKYELLTSRGIPVWVMEPVRGGKLASLPEWAALQLEKYRPDESDVAWCFDFIRRYENIGMILSGMSSPEQMKENIGIFDSSAPLSDEEEKVILSVAEKMKNSVPCTACRYCTKDCPKGLDIPDLISAYNELSVSPILNAAMFIDSLPRDKRPEACVKCGNCKRNCPQKIDVPEVLSKLSAMMPDMPNWAKMCKEREDAAKKLLSGK